MRLELTTRGSSGWEAGKALIERVYAQRYGAAIPAHAPEMVLARGASGQVMAATGLRDSAAGLFSQLYLDRPACQIASDLLGMPVRPDQIMEVCTLASVSPRAVLPLISDVVRIGQHRAMRASLFTATAHLRRLLRHVPLILFDLGPARPERIPNAAAWGRYYAADPHVCLIPDPRLTAIRQPGQEAA